MAVVPNTEPTNTAASRADDDGLHRLRPRADRRRDVVSLHRRSGGRGRGVRVGAGRYRRTRPSRLYPSLIASAARPGAIRAVRRPEFFDIGTPADYLDTSLLPRRPRGVARRRPFKRHASTARRESSDPSCGTMWSWKPGAMLRECVVDRWRPRAGGYVVARGDAARADGELAPGERRIDDLRDCPTLTRSR